MINNQPKKLLICIVIICILFGSVISAYAHEALLDIEYDECELTFKDNGSTADTGEDEIWYYLNSRDISNYENGTLVFYDKDNLPVTQ